MADLPRYPGTPRWVKVFATIVFIVVLLFVILLFTKGPGGHGPSRHTQSGQADGDAQASNVTAAAVQSTGYAPSEVCHR